MNIVNCSREHPLENLKNSSSNDDECDVTKWFDCESPANLKAGHRTPEQKFSPPHCPPAPFRNPLITSTSSDDDDNDSSSDDNEHNESGIRALDSSMEQQHKKEKSPRKKKLRREEKAEVNVESSSPVESKFSDLLYLEAQSCITINRPSSDEPEKRDCRMLVSYRVHKDDPSIMQIALIVYKSNSKNSKTRRNLMPEFGEKSSAESPSISLITSPSPSRSRTTQKAQQRAEEDLIKTAPAKTTNERALKRPMAKSSLRF